MQIKSDKFFELVTPTEVHRAGMHVLSSVHSITAKFYCQRMTVRGKCPKKCEECKVFLRSTIADITNNQTVVKNKYSLYTWLMKNQVAKAAEAAQTKFVPTKTALGEHVEIDAFEAMLQAIA